MDNYRNLFIALSFISCSMVNGQQSAQQQKQEFLLYDKADEIIAEEHIYDQGGNLIISKVTNPSLTAFIPSGGNTDKAAVIICPGGGYQTLHIQREGFRVAEAFNREGIAAFVLKYRLPDEKIVPDKSFAPLKDAQRAVQLVRENAKKWGIASGKIGIMGFSAGGHLAASTGVHYDSILVDNKLDTSLRPDFMILMYPVISFHDSLGHIGSKVNLLGKSPDKSLVRFFSNELQVKPSTPKTILFHAGDDTIVPVENSLSFYNELLKNNVPAEMHIYSKGEHGFLSIPPFDNWFNQCIYWIKVEMK